MGSGSSKVAFREVVEEVADRDVRADDKAFWDRLWRTDPTPHEVFEIVSPAAVRRLRNERVGNVEALLLNAVQHLEEVLADVDPSSVRGAMTAVSVLTRVMPFLLEAYVNSETGNVDGELERIFWGAGRESLPPKEATTVAAASAGAASDEGTAEEGTAKPVPPLGSRIVSAAMRMLFLRQVTVDTFSSCEAWESGDADNPLEVHDPTLLWAGGLGVGRKASIQGGRDLEGHRIEVMRLVLVLMCQPLFQRNVDFDPTASRFAEEVCRADAPFAAELFFSLLSVVVTYDPVGWGVPYAGSFTSDMPTRQLDMAAQLLVLLLDNGRPPLPVVSSALGQDDRPGDRRAPVRQDPPPPGERGYNVFRNLVLHGLREEEDFRTVFVGLSRLLNNLHRSRSTYMPGSGVAVNCHQEVLVLLWKLMEENPVFTQYVLKHCDINEILVPVCYLLVENRKDVSKGGLIHICTFVLLKLSGERLFGVAINKPCAVRLPTDLPLFSGTHLDLLILTVHKLLVAGSERLSTLYHCFLTVLCNVSPYCKCMSLVASVKLLNLFELFTSPANLYGSETNQMYVSLLLEMFSNIIQYQYAGNAHLIYAIVRRQEAFESLFRLDLPSAIAAAAKFAKSGGARSRKATAGASAAPDTAGGVEAGATAAAPAPPAAIGLKAGPEEKEAKVSAASAVLQQSSSSSASDARRGSARHEVDGARANEDDDGSVPMRFRPTQEWLDSVRSEVPFNTIMRLLSNLTPQVEELCQERNALDENTMVNFVSNTTMVGLLPVPHPIVIRKYHPNQHTAIWFTAFMWGVIFVRNQELPVFDGKMVRLFTVTTA